MMLIQRKNVTVTVLALAVLAAGAGLLGHRVLADKNAGVSGVQGVLKAQDTAKSTITVTVPGGKGRPAEDKVFELAKDGKLLIDHVKDGKFADLSLGVHLTLELSAEQKVIRGRATGSSISGTLKAVDAAKNTLLLTTIASKGSPAEDKTYDVAKTARITNDKQEARLADLPADLRVTVTLGVDEKTVIAVAATALQPKGASSVRGSLTAVDVDRKKFTLLVGAGKGNPGEDHTYDVPATAKIVIDYVKDGKLADLKTGTLVTVDLSADQKVAGIRAVGPGVHGVLKAVDAGKNTLTLTVNISKGNPGEDKTYDVVKDARILTPTGQPAGKLADLPTGGPATLTLSVDQKVVIAITVASP